MCLPLPPTPHTAIASFFFNTTSVSPSASGPFLREQQSQPCDISALPTPAQAGGSAIANYSIMPQNWLLADALGYREYPQPGCPCARLELS